VIGEETKKRTPFPRRRRRLADGIRIIIDYYIYHFDFCLLLFIFGV
jgi:hypothetical protein